MSSTLRVTSRIIQYELRDILRSRWLFAYAAFFAVTTDVLLRFGGSGSKALLSLLSLVLFLIPLVAVVYATAYLYQMREFTELVASQPVRRSSLFTGLYLGMVLPLSAAFVAGVGIPLLAHGLDGAGLWRIVIALMAAGVALTFLFVAVAAWIVIRVEDRVKGLGLAIATWLVFGVLYDGIVLLVAALFADHAIEKVLLGLMLFNPIDLARVALLLQFDIAALMGYTGAVFRKVLGGGNGTAIATAALAAWLVVTLFFAARRFERKDF